MSDEDQIPELLADLASADPQDRLALLAVLVEDPTGDPRIIAALKPLLEDRTVAILTIPLVYGELRWLAAQALANELSAAGEVSEVCLSQVIEPLRGDELQCLAEQTFGSKATSWSALRQFEQLRDEQVLRSRDRIFRGGPIRGV